MNTPPPMRAKTGASGYANTSTIKKGNQKVEVIVTGALTARSSRQKRNLLKQSKIYNSEKQSYDRKTESATQKRVF